MFILLIFTRVVQMHLAGTLIPNYHQPNMVLNSSVEIAGTNFDQLIIMNARGNPIVAQNFLFQTCIRFCRSGNYNFVQLYFQPTVESTPLLYILLTID